VHSAVSNCALGPLGEQLVTVELGGGGAGMGVALPPACLPLL
jgi:hypothetical protein